MVHKDLSPKPAYYAYKTLIRMLPNGSTRPVLTVKDGIYKAEWKRPDGIKVAAYWCKEGFTSINLESESQTVIDYSNRITPLNDKLKISCGVVYVVTK